MTNVCGEMNLLHPTNFQVVIDRKDYPNIVYYANSVNHSGVNLANTTNARFRHIQNIPYPGDSITFDTVTFDIIIDEQMAGYREIFSWLNRMVDSTYVPPSEETSKIPTSEEDISLLIYTASNTLTRTIRYINAFPISLGDIDFRASETEAAIITCPATFAFLYFEIE